MVTGRRKPATPTRVSVLCRYSAALCLVAALAWSCEKSYVPVVNSAVRTSGASPASATSAAPLARDDASAPVVFLPGLLGSALSCGSVNLWPGGTSDLIKWDQHFAALPIVNAVEDGKLVHRTASSNACGSVPFAGGTVAVDEPRAVSALWCMPEKASELSIDAQACRTLEHTAYATFGLAVQAQLKANGRGQPWVPYGWDWRLAPEVQVAAFHDKLKRVTAARGRKATVLAHSFGNTFFRAWVTHVESLGERAGDYVGRFVSVAGPWWGVATAWTHPAYGSLQPGLQSRIASDLIGVATVAEVFSSMPGTYSLLPHAAFDEYVSTLPGKRGEHWLAVAEVGAVSKRSAYVPFANVPSVVKTALDRCPEPAIFPCQNERLYRDAQRRMPKVGFNKSGIKDWVGIVGAGVQTALQICHGCDEWPSGTADEATSSTADGPFSDSLTPIGITSKHLTRTTNGDANVPVFSAIQGSDPNAPPGEKVEFFFTCGITHMGLMTEERILERLVPYVTGEAPLGYDEVLTRVPCAL